MDTEKLKEALQMRLNTERSLAQTHFESYHESLAKGEDLSTEVFWECYRIRSERAQCVESILDLVNDLETEDVRTAVNRSLS